MKHVLMLSLMLGLAIASLSAQIDMSRLELNPFMRGMLAPNKLSMSHSMGFEAGTSSNGMGYYLSRYTNHLSYKFNPKLELDLDLSLVNFGSASTNSGIEFNNDNNSKIIPEFSLRYKPSDSVSFELRYVQRPWMQSSMMSPWYQNPAR